MDYYTTRRLSDSGYPTGKTRHYHADGTRMQSLNFLIFAEHQPYASRMETRRDGSIIVREYYKHKARS